MQTYLSVEKLRATTRSSSHIKPKCGETPSNNSLRCKHTWVWRNPEQQPTTRSSSRIKPKRGESPSNSSLRLSNNSLKFTHKTQAWRISEQQLTRVLTYLSVKKPRATTRSGSHIIHNTQAWRISEQQLTHVQTYLSVEKPRATTHSGLYINGTKQYTFYIIVVFIMWVKIRSFPSLKPYEKLLWCAHTSIGACMPQNDLKIHLAYLKENYK